MCRLQKKGMFFYFFGKEHPRPHRSFVQISHFQGPFMYAVVALVWMKGIFYWHMISDFSLIKMYALGKIFYYLLGGHVDFQESSQNLLMREIAEDTEFASNHKTFGHP